MIIHKNMYLFISRSHNKASEDVKLNIKRNSKGMSSSNLTAKYDKSSFSTSCITSCAKNQITPQKGSIFYGHP